MARNALHDVAIVAVHNTKQARSLDEDEGELLLNAFRAVLIEAGLKASDINGVHAHGMTQGIDSPQVVDWLGGHACWSGSYLPGIGAVMQAAGAIAFGQCDTVLLGAAQSGAHRTRGSTAPWTRSGNEFSSCWGLYTAPYFALLARRHMAIFGTPVEAFAEVASSIRTNGSRYPGAVFEGKAVSPEDVLASRMIADPLRLLDCAVTSEGGAAMIITTRERARDMDVTPVYILGGCLDNLGTAYAIPPTYEQCGMAGERAGNIVFSQAGLNRDDVDVCEFYDPFSFEVIRQLEAFGFCKAGEGADFVLDGNIRMGGRLPVSTDGGLMAYSHAGSVQALQRIIAGVMQLRGDRPPQLKVPGAKVAMISNMGGAAHMCDAMLLGLEPA